MGEIVWGPAIVVKDKRPEWLGDGVPLQWAMVNEGGSYTVYQQARSDTTKNWSGFGYGVAIRLPADHPHYAEKPADTVTIARMTEAEARHYFLGRTEGTNQDRFVALLHELGIICEETISERFTRETGHPVTPAVEAALMWGRT